MSFIIAIIDSPYVFFLNRNVKNKCQYFGGAQVVLCGDLTQLRPVPSETDDGTSFILSSIYHLMNPHVIILQQTQRCNPMLFNIVKEAGKGKGKCLNSYENKLHTCCKCKLQFCH